MHFSAESFLIYFNILPINIFSSGISRWVIGSMGGIWFLASINILIDQLSKTNIG